MLTVDIRYIQEMLGHSSITVTEIYTHVALSKQKDILMTKHPRQKFSKSDFLACIKTINSKIKFCCTNSLILKSFHFPC